MSRIELVHAREAAIELLHLLHIADCLLLCALGRRGRSDGTIGIDDRVGHVAQRLGHSAKALQVGRYARDLLDVGLCSLRQVGHVSDLLGGIAQLLDALAKAARVLFGNVQPHRRHTDLSATSRACIACERRTASALQARQIAKHNRAAAQTLAAVAAAKTLQTGQVADYDRSAAVVPAIATAAELGSVEWILGLQHGEDLFPMVFVGRSLKG